MKNIFPKKSETFAKWRKTLKADLIISILLTWVIPYVAVMSFALYMIGDTQRQRMMDTYVMNALSAQKISSERIKEAMNASLSASYAPTIRRHYEDCVRQGDKTRIEESVQNFLTDKYKNDEKFNLTVLYYADAPDVIYYTFGSKVGSSYKSIDYFMSEAYPRTLELYPGLGSSFGFFSSSGRMYMIRNLYLANEQPYAVLVMELNQNNIFSPIDGIVRQEGSYITLAGNERLTGGEELASMLPGYQEDGGECVRIKGKYYVRAWTTVEEGMKLGSVTELSEGAVAQRINSAYIISIALMLMLIPMIISLVRLIELKISKPIGRLVRASEKIEKGDWGYTITKQPGSKEFEILTDAFNHMSLQLSSQVEKMYAEELALRDARIMALQSQINPHFLNNTLEIINWEARLGETAKVSRMLEALGTMLEAALDRKKRPLVRLSEELAYMEAYLYIISERFGKRLEVEKRIDDRLLDCNVPRLILQPILENAVEHGVATRQRGRIIIEIKADGDYIIMTVLNDGRLTPEDEKKIRDLLYGGAVRQGERSVNLGIRNVNERIKIICGEPCGLEIVSTEDGMTASIIKLERDIEEM